MKKIILLFICLIHQIINAQNTNVIVNDTLKMNGDLILNGFFKKLIILSDNQNDYFLRGEIINNYEEEGDKIVIKSKQKSIRIVPPETTAKDTVKKKTIIKTVPDSPPPKDDDIDDLVTKKKGSSITIFPMPFTNELTISSKKNKITKYTLYDSLGIKRVENTTINLSLININTSHLNSGLYVIYFYLDDGSILIKNIIKN